MILYAKRIYFIINLWFQVFWQVQKLGLKNKGYAAVVVWLDDGKNEGETRKYMLTTNQQNYTELCWKQLLGNLNVYGFTL